LFEGALDGFALRVHDGLFGGDDDFCFHARAPKFCGKRPVEASEKVWSSSFSRIHAVKNLLTTDGHGAAEPQPP
jgi:hypothetical protein